jgi:hypothetical protein
MYGVYRGTPSICLRSVALPGRRISVALPVAMLVAGRSNRDTRWRMWRYCSSRSEGGLARYRCVDSMTALMNSHAVAMENMSQQHDRDEQDNQRSEKAITMHVENIMSRNNEFY